jgi:carbonic anhydrase
VLGHAQCGGIRALLEGSPMAGRGDDFIGAWMANAARARQRTLERDLPQTDRQHVCELETVKVSLENLTTFPWIRERVQTERLALHGWYFDIADGRLLQLDPATQEFTPVEA